MQPNPIEINKPSSKRISSKLAAKEEAKKALFINLSQIEDNQHLNTRRGLSPIQLHPSNMLLNLSPAKTSIKIDQDRSGIATAQDTKASPRFGGEVFGSGLFKLKKMRDLEKNVKDQNSQVVTQNSLNEQTAVAYGEQSGGALTKQDGNSVANQNCFNGFNLEPQDSSSGCTNDRESYESSSVGSISLSEEDFFIDRKDVIEQKIAALEGLFDQRKEFLNPDLEVSTMIRKIREKSDEITHEDLRHIVAPRGMSIGFKELCLLRFVENHFVEIL